MTTLAIRAGRRRLDIEANELFIQRLEDAAARRGVDPAAYSLSAIRAKVAEDELRAGMPPAVARLHDAGYTNRQIADQTGLLVGQIRKAINAAGLRSNR